MGDTPDCATCRIAVQKIHTLGERWGRGTIPSLPNGFGLGPDSTYWLTFENHGELPLVFDKTGEFLNTIGRTGRGPGEFSGPVIARWFGSDTVYVMDFSQGRLSAYSGFDRNPARMASVHGPVGTSDYLVLSNGSMVTNARNSSRQFVGEPIHLFDSGGAHQLSVDGDGAVVRSGDALKLKRGLARKPDGSGWWSLDPYYTLQEWSNRGDRLQAYGRTPAWLVPNITLYTPDRSHPPPSMIVGLSIDDGGRLWIAFNVPDQNWRDAVVRGRTPFSEDALVVEDYNKLLDTVVEVVDVSLGVLLASTRVDPALTHISFPFAVSGSDDFDDRPRVDVWRFDLIQLGRR